MGGRGVLVSEIEVLWSGFSSFFSVWQVCILQISPFFMVFMLGLNSAVFAAGMPAHRNRWVVLPALVYPIGFSVVFALLSASGLYISRFLSYNIESLQFVAGLFFLVVASHFILIDRLAWVKRWTLPWVVALFSILLGVTFAIIYSPCITPTLSRILGLGIHPESAVRGGVLAFFYGLGMSLAFSMVGAALLLFLKSWSRAWSHAPWIKDGCAAIFLILSGMNLTGVMVYYKAFFL